MEKHHPREETKEKEMVVLSEKGRKISIKTEAASSSMKPFEEQPVEHEEGSLKKKIWSYWHWYWDRIWREMDTEEEESKVRKLTQRRIKDVSSI